jgi:peptidylprolyl isomerase
MSPVKKGDTVMVHYVGKLGDGTVFDNNEQREPLTFTIGSGNIIPGFEKGIIGMEVGEIKEVIVSPDEGFGDKKEDLEIPVKKSDFPDDITPSVGQRLQFKRPDGTIISVTIKRILDDDVILDANHPLAGEMLNFEIKLLEIK